MIIWNEQTVHWFRQASEYTGYNRELAGLLLESLPTGGTLCDMGCGSGLVDFELAPYFREITCVDISEAAAAAVERTAAERGIAHVKALCADGSTVSGKWDCVMALFHGGPEAFERYYPKAAHTLLIATHASKVGDLGPQNRRVIKESDVAGLAAYLDARSIRYTLRNAELEYGQPLADPEEARRFVRNYAMPMESGELEAYLEQNLRKTGREDFPYYLPKQRKFGIFVIRRGDNA